MNWHMELEFTFTQLLDMRWKERPKKKKDTLWKIYMHYKAH